MPDRPAIPANPWKKVLACAAGLALYTGLFFGSAAERRESLLLVLWPDDVCLALVGGDFGKFSILDRSLVLLAAALVLGTAFLAGRMTLAGLSCRRFHSTAEQLVFATGVGLNELSLLTLGLGMCGWLRQRWLCALLLGGIWLLAGRPWKLAHLGRVKVAQDPGGPSQASSCGSGSATDPEQVPTPSRATWLERHGLWLAVPFVALQLLGGVLPPVDFDVREYHLQVPKEWFQAGRVDFLPHNVYGNMPLGAEMHALLAMTLLPGPRAWWWGALVGKVVMAAFAPLTALALYAAGRRFVSPTAGVVAALVYLSTPGIAHVSVNGLNDGAVGFYLFLACYAYWIWAASFRQPVSPVAEADRLPTGRRGWVLLSGFLAGAAAACKYPAFLLIVTPLTAAVFVRGRAWNWRPTCCLLLAVACGCGLWLGKNWWYTGNPVYPLVLGGQTRTAEKMVQWNRAHQVPRNADGQCYTLPQAAESLAVIGWRGQMLSLLLVPLAALAWAAREHRRFVGAVGGFLAFFVLAWWLCTHRLERFLVPAIPLAALLAGVGAEWSAVPTWRRVLVGFLGLGLAVALLQNLAAPDQDHRLFVALETLRRDEPPEPQTPSRVDPVHRFLNDTVPAGATVLLVGDAQPFDLEVPVLYNTCFDDCIFEQLLKGRSRDERLAALERHKISHIYISWHEIARYLSPGNYGFTKYVTKELVRDELVRQQKLLRPVDVGLNSESVEVFEVCRR